MVLPELDLIGGPTDVLKAHLAEDVCFGKHYAKTVKECRECVCPVVVEERVLLLSEVCAALCGKAAPGHLKRLTSKEIEKRLSTMSVVEIFKEIVNEMPVEQAAADARALLYDRLYYLREEKGVPVPDLPSTEDLVAALGSY